VPRQEGCGNWKGGGSAHRLGARLEKIHNHILLRLSINSGNRTGDMKGTFSSQDDDTHD